MFGLFKKKQKPIHELPISEAIVEFKRQGGENLGINLYIRDQILFQVMAAKHFEGKGLELANKDDMAAVHFFNKNKTLTQKIWEKFKSEKSGKDFLHYEEPEGVFYYIKNIGNIPVIIEQEIQSQMKLYELSNDLSISREYVG